MNYYNKIYSEFETLLRHAEMCRELANPDMVAGSSYWRDRAEELREACVNYDKNREGLTDRQRALQEAVQKLLPLIYAQAAHLLEMWAQWRIDDVRREVERAQKMIADAEKLKPDDLNVQHK